MVLVWLNALLLSSCLNVVQDWMPIGMDSYLCDGLHVWLNNVQSWEDHSISWIEVDHVIEKTGDALADVAVLSNGCSSSSVGIFERIHHIAMKWYFKKENSAFNRSLWRLWDGRLLTITIRLFNAVYICTFSFLTAVFSLH